MFFVCAHFRGQDMFENGFKTISMKTLANSSNLNLKKNPVLLHLK
jgi:hypothetical protein